MNLDIDYNSKMLTLYFKEKDFSNEEIQQLLNDNPFNFKFTKWEKNVQYYNRILANTIKRKKLVNENTVLQEVTNHKDNSISRYLNNNSEYYSTLNFFKRNDGIVLIHDSIYRDNKAIKILCEKNNSFITGICTRDYVRYKKKLIFYKEILNKYKNIQLTEALENGHSICLIKKM